MGMKATSEMNCPHCKTEIDEHEANRCLDAWVAERVFGKRIEFKKGAATAWQNDKAVMWFPNDFVDLDDKSTYMHTIDGYTGMVHFYSTFIAAAWEVVGQMTAPDTGAGGDSWKLEWLAGSYRAGFGYGKKAKDVTYWKAIADTAPLAICRAALKAGKWAK